MAECIENKSWAGTGVIEIQLGFLYTNTYSEKIMELEVGVALGKGVMLR